MNAAPASAAMVYLDYAATAPLMPQVAQRMAEVLALPPGNAAASHAAGRAAAALIDAARAQVAALIHAEPADLVFTSGATESNNLAITGTARATRARAGVQPHVITLATEHKSVLEPVRALAAQGIAVTVLKPDAEGLLDAATLAAALRPGTCLVSLLHVNNETGVAQDIRALAAVCAAHAVPLHVDASQSAGKLPLDVAGITLLSFTAHKIGGPQGIGALYVSASHRGRIEALQLGGGHERGLRSGTLPTHQIVGFGLACELADAQQEPESVRLTALREQLWEGLKDLPGVLRNGHPAQCAPGILNLTFSGVEGESLFNGLPGLALATGSACNSRSGEPSYVLRALGRSTAQAQASLRFSLGWGSTAEHVAHAVAAVRQVHQRLWENSPARPAPTGDWKGEVAVGEAGNERLGTWVRFAVRVESGRVAEARAQVYGCPETAAACSHVLREIRGAPLSALAPGTPEDWRVLVSAPVEKLGQMLIIEDALSALRLAPITRNPT